MRDFDLKKFTMEGKSIPLPRWLSIISLIFLVGFFSFGIYSVFEVYDRYSETITSVFETFSPLLAEIVSNKFVVILFPVVSILVGFVITFLSLNFSKHHSDLLVKIVIGLYIFFSIVLILAGVVLYLLFPAGGILILVLTGIAGIAIVYVGLKYFKNTIRRAIEFLRMSSEVVMQEKGLLLAPVVLMFLEMLLLISFVGILGNLFSSGLVTLGVTGVNPLQALIFVASFAAFGFLSAVFSYSLLGVNVAIVYIWYRGHDPSLKDGARAVLYQLPDILVFGLYNALVYAIKGVFYLIAIAAAAGGRRGGARIAGGIARLANRVIDAIWGTINYFTMPALIIEDLPTKIAIKRSIYMLVKYFPDVVVKESVADDAIGIMSFVLFLIFGTIGFVMSWVFLPHEILWIAFGTLSVIFLTALPSSIILSTLSRAYHTILYSWALDEEANKKPPYERLGAIADEISRIIGLKKDLEANGKMPKKEDIEKARRKFLESYY